MNLQKTIPGVFLFGVLLVLVSSAPANELVSLEKAAAKLQETVLTVRVIPQKSTKPAADSVTVCSGVSLGDGLVVTFIRPTSASKIRITIPGGDQAEAKIRVVDHYSGLTLLEIDNQELPGLEFADSLPGVGAWVASAAAWGAERPVVSLGILSGTDRSIRGSSFPPLLQCDLRTAETSSGAAIVNKDGELIGVVVATEAPGERSGWTYAVPASHVQRMMRARGQSSVESQNGVIVLARRRPVVGAVLNQGRLPGSVVVERITKDGPADRAGIKKGDEVLAVDGLKIRSTYQAVAPLMKKQPGDRIAYMVRQSDGTRNVDITLGGGVEMPAANANNVARLFDPRLQIQQVGPRQFNVSGVRNLSVKSEPDTTSVQPTDDDRIKLMEKALNRYSGFIQEELRRREKERADYDETIRSLKSQIEELEEQLEANKSP